MKKHGIHPEVIDNLRQKAEVHLKNKQTKTSLTFSETDMLKLIHELEVHQIELEMQNEELVLAKEKAELAEEKYTELYDFSPSGYFTLSRQGKILEMNLRSAQMLGKERSFLINSQFELCIKEDSRIVFANFLEEMFQGKSNAVCDVSFNCKDNNNNLYVHLTGIISEKKEQCFITATDITERKKAEEELKKNLAKYEVLINTFPIGITLSDKEGNIVETNEKALELLGLQREEHLKRKLKGEEWKIIKTDGTIFPQDEYASVKALKENRLVENVEMGIVKSKEDITWLNVTAAPIPIEDFGVVIAYNDISERKRLEEKIRRNQERFKALTDVSLTGIWTTDSFGKNTYVSPRWSMITGISPEEAKGTGWSKGLHPDDRELIMNDWKRTGAEDKPKTYDFRFIRPDGSLVWVLSQATVVKDNDGKIIEWIGTITDITELKQMENALRENEERLRFALMATNDVVWDWDIVNDSQQWNVAGKKVFGWTEIVDNTVNAAWWIERIHPDDRKRVEDGFNAALQNNSDIHWHDEYRFRKSDGTFAEVLDRGHILRDTKGKPMRMIGAMQDITERIKAEKLIKENEHRFRTVADFTYDMEYWQLPDGRLNYISPSCERITGYTRNEFLSNPGLLAKIIHPDDFPKFIGHCNIENADNTDCFEREINLRIIKKDSSVIWIEHGCRAVFDDNNNYLGRRVSHRDITERKNAELALIESELFANTIASSTPALLYLYDFEKEENIWTNDAHKRFFEEINKNSGGMQFADIVQLIHPADINSAVANQNELTDSGSISRFNAEIRIKCKDSWKWMTHVVKVFKTDNTGKPLQLLGALFDIDEMKRTQQDLLDAKERAEESENFFRSIFENSPAGKSITGLDGTLKTNKAFSDMLGYSFEEFQNKKVIDITHPDDLQKSLDVIETLLKGEEPVIHFEKKYIHKNRSVVYSEVVTALQKGRDGKPLFFITSVNDITERKQNEEKLVKSEERYALVIEASEQGIWDWNVETNEVFYSEQWKKQIGYKDHELKNEFNTWVEHLHPDEKEYCQNAVLSYLKQPVEHFILDFRFRHKDGTYRWIHNKAASLKNNEGKVIRLFGTHTDITESKLSEAIFKDIIEKNPMSIQILDMEGYPIQCNSAHTRLFGVEPPSDYSVLKDPQLLSHGFGKLFKQIKKGEVVYFPDSYYNVHDVDPSFPDSAVWVKALGFTLNDINGKPGKIVLMHENITERKNAEALLNDIIENNPMSIQVVDKEGHTLRGNPAFIQLFGSVPPPEFSIFDDLKSKGAELENLVSKVKNGEIVHLPDVYFNAHDAVKEAPDIPLWIRALIFPLNDSVGKPERFVFMHENITDSKIAEQELIKAKEHAEESDRLKSAFLANMSHEIRTPMNGILGFSELLKEPGLTGKQQQEYIRIIEKSGARMLNIINDIVDISKIEAGLMNVNIIETDINEKIDFIYIFFKPQVEEKGMQFLCKKPLPVKEAIIRTDNEKVYSILTNLVKNAIKFSEEGKIEFGYERKGNDIEFFVKDTGIGIPKERKNAIFERFIQADISDKMARQGAGLGLAISKAYVEMLGGKIWAESEEGIGSTFYFTLPYNTEPDEAEGFEKDVTGLNENNLNNPEVLGLKIVIAEDDEISEMLISLDIKEFSRKVIKVKTGLEAVEVCRNNPDIDLILMDIQMPDLNGYEAAQQIRQFNKTVVIIAQTAFGLSGDREKAIEAGCNDHIAKPINKNELLALIQKYFKK